MRISVSPHLGPVRVTLWSWSSRRRPVRQRSRRPSVLLAPFLIVWWLLLAEAWIVAEALLLAVTGILVIVDLCRRTARFEDIRVTGLRWGLFILDVKGN